MKVLQSGEHIKTKNAISVGEHFEMNKNNVNGTQYMYCM